MPLEFQLNDLVFHKQFGAGTIVRKTGPTFVRSLDEWMEATYAVWFAGCCVPGLYYNELSGTEIGEK